MKKIYCLLVSMSILFIFPFTMVTGFAAENENNSMINVEYKNGIKFTTVINSEKQNNNFNVKTLASNDKIFDSDFVDYELLSVSNKLVIQEQHMAVNDEGEVITLPISATSPTISWNDTEGYITLYTSYYKLSQKMPNGDPIYVAKGEAVIHKEFKMRKKERFTITHSSNATYLNEDISNVDYTGHQTYTLDDTYTTGALQRHYYDELIRPQFENQCGLIYEFTYPTGKYVDSHHEKKYYDFGFKGQYAFSLPGNGSIQVCYVHNEKLFGDISVSLSYAGLGVSVNGMNTKYCAEPLTIIA